MDHAEQFKAIDSTEKAKAFRDKLNAEQLNATTNNPVFLQAKLQAITDDPVIKDAITDPDAKPPKKREAVKLVADHAGATTVVKAGSDQDFFNNNNFGAGLIGAFDVPMFGSSPEFVARFLL